jgi:RNA polymerase sigma factor (sigma-70 family)
MARKLNDMMLTAIRAAVRSGRDDGAPDTDLLDRYVTGHDEEAFATLVRRHAGMVLGVARRVLSHEQDAEDVCQATFVLLARKASRGLRRQSVAGWLCTTARLTALNALKARSRRTRAEAATRGQAGESYAPTPLERMTGAELVAALDEELARLPDRYRAPLVLCCIEGLSRDTAARRLGVPVGTLRVQLERARERLRTALSNRGIELGVVLLAVMLAPADSFAQAQLVRSVIAAAVRGIVPPGVAALTQGITTMTKTSLVLIAAMAAGLGLATIMGASRLSSVAATKANAREEAAQAIPPAKEPAATPDRKDQDMPAEVAGQVLDPDGRPVNGAKVYLCYSMVWWWQLSHARIDVPRPADASAKNELLSASPRVTTGDDGKFRLTLSRRDFDQAILDEGAQPAVIAVAGGYGPAWGAIGGKTANLTLRLVRDDVPINGRILDEDGKPVGGASLRVTSLGTRAGQKDKWAGPVPGLPATVTTGADGRFRLTGLGRDRNVVLQLAGKNIQHRPIIPVTLPAGSFANPKTQDAGSNLLATFDFVARASRSIRGVVKDKASGKPLAGVRMTSQETEAIAYTDNEGRYELPGMAKARHYAVTAQPPNGQLYFAAHDGVDDTPGLEPLTLDFALAQGMEMRGRVTSRATGKPVKDAVVAYYPLFPNENTKTISGYPNGPASSAVTDAKGFYRLAALRGPGVIGVVAAPRDNYANAPVTSKALADLFKDKGDHGNEKTLYADHGAVYGFIDQERFSALILVSPAQGAETATRDIALGSAVSVKGVVLGPDNKPLTGANVMGLESWSSYQFLGSGEFEVKRLVPGRTRELVFEHKEKGLGKFLTVSAERNEPLTVRLEPYGSVTGRLVDKDGKPVAGARVQMGRAGFVCPDLPEKTDRDGRFRASGLVPGQKYSVQAFREDIGWSVKFTAGAGQENDVGNIRPVKRSD